MQRLNARTSDRGAVAIWVALLLVPFLIVAALAIDIGAVNADRQRLQQGADAAALAIAQDCASDGCGQYDDTASALVSANDPNGGPAEARVLELDADAGWVEVQASSERDFWFAPVIGDEGTEIAAWGAASWNNFPTGGTHLPLAISWCEIAHWAGLGPDDVITEDGAIVGLNIPEETTDVVLFSKGRASDFHACPAGTGPNGPNGYAPPGGFGWLVAPSDCTATTAADGWSSSSTGRPTTCPDLAAMIGQTVLVPVYSETRVNGSNAEYKVFGYIGFTLEGFRNNKGSAGVVPAACTANADCIFGTIRRYVELGDSFDSSPDGPQLGASLVELRLP